MKNYPTREVDELSDINHHIAGWILFLFFIPVFVSLGVLGGSNIVLLVSLRVSAV